MAYRFRSDEPFAKGFRRIASEQIGAAIERLEQPPGDPANVHECRKNIKRTRALLRLMRPALGETTFKRENTRLRDVGRLLSERRDLQVLGETIAKLEARLGATSDGALEKLRLALATAPEGAEAAR